MSDTCGTCKHWRRQPASPLALDPRTRPGECFRHPPQVVAVPGPQGVGLTLVRPPLPPDCPACGDYEPRPAGDDVAGAATLEG